MSRLPESELVLVPGGTLITATPEAGRALAVKMARHMIHNIQPDLQWYPTTHTPEGSVREDAIPGHEFSGWVESVGDGVEGLVPGCEVFGMNSWFSQGATAEYCLARPQDVAAKPKSLTHAEGCVCADKRGPHSTGIPLQAQLGF